MFMSAHVVGEVCVVPVTLTLALLPSVKVTGGQDVAPPETQPAEDAGSKVIPYPAGLQPPEADIPVTEQPL